MRILPLFVIVLASLAASCSNSDRRAQSIHFGPSMEDEDGDTGADDQDRHVNT